MELVDIPAVLAIQAASPEAAQWTAGDYERACQGLMYGTVAEGRGVVGGFLVGRRVSEELEILNLAVRREYRRQGIATELLADTLESGRTWRAKKVFLEVRESNASAIAFYSHYGFATTGRRPHYYRRPAEDALVLARPLFDEAA